MLKEEEIITAATVSAEDKAWTEGKMIFRAMLFEEIAVELERNFGKKVVFKNEEDGKFQIDRFISKTIRLRRYYIIYLKQKRFLILYQTKRLLFPGK